MKTATITITGRTNEDLKIALEQVASQIGGGCLLGFDHNGSRRYRYEVDGEEGEYSVTNDEGDTLLLTASELTAMVELHNEHRDEDYIDLDDAMGDDVGAADARQAAFDFAMAKQPALLSKP